MFRWYNDSVICYAYLSDVATLDGLENGDSDFRKRRWFTRGWTLQELLAPDDLVFFDQGWNGSRSKLDIPNVVSEITGIPKPYIAGVTFGNPSVAQKMAWASQRTTTRKEDMAYCLLGIFRINMPLLYGEGERAFTRLQEEIVKQTQDQSVFAWGLHLPLNMENIGGIFARSPAEFKGCHSLISLTDYNRSDPSQMTNKGMQLRLEVFSGELCPGIVYGGIECGDVRCGMIIPLIPLENKPLEDGDGFWRPPTSVPIRIRAVEDSNNKEKPLEYSSLRPKNWNYNSIMLYLKSDLTGLGYSTTTRTSTPLDFRIKGIPLLSPNTFLKKIFPQNYWLQGTQIFRYQSWEQANIECIFLRFHSLREQADSVVVFRTRYRRGTYVTESNIISWEQIHSYLEPKQDIGTIAELFWNDPSCLEHAFWLREPTASSEVLKVDLTQTKTRWTCNISRRFE